MANILKKELEELGFKEIPEPVKFPFRYKILHVVSGTYLKQYDSYTDTRNVVNTKTKGKAGNIREIYRLGKTGGAVMYFLDEDIEKNKQDTNFRWQIAGVLLNSRRELYNNPLDVNEFEIIEEPYVEPSLDTTNSSFQK